VSLADLEKTQVPDPKTKKTKRSNDDQSDSTRKNDPGDIHTSAQKRIRRQLHLTDPDDQD